MGSDISKEAAAYGQIFVQTDKVAYVAGETVTGRIYLNMFQPYQGNQLHLKIKGKEVAHILEQVDVTRQVEKDGAVVTENYKVDKLYDEKKEIIKMTVPVYNWATLLPGQFVVPFAFILPPNLPASFHQRGHRYLADISYRLEAILEPFDKKSTPRLKSKSSLVVREPVRNAVQGPSNEIKTELKSCCCIGKGSNVLKVSFEKNYYTPGEIAQVITQLDNTQSQMPNLNIKFALKQNLTLTANGRNTYKPLTKVERLLPGIAAGSSSNSNLIALNLPPFKGEEYKKVKTYNLTSYLLESQEENQFMNSTTKGSLIKSDFLLEVSCQMDGCCAPSPTISLPIQIFFPEYQPMQVAQPENWSPEMIPNVNVAFQPGLKITVNSGITMGGNTMDY